MRVGLVLGAGGAVGASYLTGALEGLRRATGFEPRVARVVVGTSAGAFIGALALSMPVALIYKQCTGDSGDVAFDEVALARAAAVDRHNRAQWFVRFPPARRFPRPFLSSPRAVWSALSDRTHTPMFAGLTGLLGEGVISTRLVGSIVRDANPNGWPEGQFRVATYDLDAGRRVIFSRAHESGVDVATAVRAATAVPVVFAPVVIGGRRYVDGGVFSASNLDLLKDDPLDVIVCINPLSGGSVARDQQNGSLVSRALDQVDVRARARIDARLDMERRSMPRGGAPVFVIHPEAEDLAAMPYNYMDVSARERVVRIAAKTVERSVRAQLSLASALSAAR